MGLWAQASWDGGVACIARGAGKGFTAVQAQAGGDADSAGVQARSDEGSGVVGRSAAGRGLWGISDNFMGTVGDSTNGTGVFGHSVNGAGVIGWGVPAAKFIGDVEVDGDIRLIGDGNGDCAEEFEGLDGVTVEPGSVVVIDQGGAMVASEHPYDRRVAGVVAGAGGTRPAIVLNRKVGERDRVTVALVGKVMCKVDARPEPVRVGDLLTTSATPGYAMRAVDRERSFGSVLGKALRPLDAGLGLVPVLICLQ